jgi:hypothetical protein
MHEIGKHGNQSQVTALFIDQDAPQNMAIAQSHEQNV